MNGTAKITIRRCTPKGDPVISTYTVGEKQLEEIMEIVTKQARGPKWG